MQGLQRRQHLRAWLAAQLVLGMQWQSQMHAWQAKKQVLDLLRRLWILPASKAKISMQAVQ